MAKSPEHGGRILLTRDEVDAEGASYVVRLETKDAAYVGRLRIHEADGSVRVEPFADEPPAWLLAQVAPIARTMWTSRRKDPDLPWPRRLHRWRPER